MVSFNVLRVIGNASDDGRIVENPSATFTLIRVFKTTHLHLHAGFDDRDDRKMLIKLSSLSF